MDENYISLERAIERMYEVTEECGTECIYIDRIIDELENLPSCPNICIHPRWIPVTEWLPEHGEVVLSRLTFNELRILQWDNVSRWWLGYGAGDDWRQKDVTHWMPMPQPPKEEDNAM